VKAKIYDLEVLVVMFYALFYDIETKTFKSFEISKYKNDLYSLVKYLEDRDFTYLIGYNNLNYDSQILQYILENYEKWSDLTGEEIARKLSIFSGKVINATNYGGFPPYSEYSLSVKQIDLFKIHHFDNENRRTSLKWLQYMMNWENVEEMPYHFADETLTYEQLEEIKEYCKNDVLSTHLFYLYTIGEVDHKFYSGKNKIADRLILIEEGVLPEAALNYSDSKIGDELNKRSYCKITNKKINDLYELKRKRKKTKPFTFGEAIPPYVKFETPELKSFYERVKKERVSLLDSDKQFFPLKFRGTEYLIARGGIHSNESHRVTIPKSNEILRDADVGSQYPNAIKKRKLFPKHLGIEWNMVGVDNIKKKDYYKQSGKKETEPILKQKLKGWEGLYKLALNAGYFGKTIEKTNWQYSPEVGFFCTIGNQFEILMLIEMLELAGIHCISANTDGIVCLFDKNLEETYYKTCNEWEKIVGNDVEGKLEYTDFAGLYQESVNHYVAVKTNGEVKVKGRFSTEDEINKNNSDKISRIERLALVDYFSKGIPVEKTIRECKNPHLFLIGKKASKDYRWETVHPKTNKITEYKKLIRFYISLDGEKLVRSKNEDSLATGPKHTQYYSGSLVTIKNKINSPTIDGWNIDYDYYIKNISEVINKIEKLRKNKKFIEPPKEQGSLF
jgi:hypothetical protein